MYTVLAVCKVPDIVERLGYIPMRVDTPKPGESFLAECGKEIVVCDAPDSRFCDSPDALRLILRPPQFREGGYYWNASGELRGPLRKVEVDSVVYWMVDQNNTSYRSDGWHIPPGKLDTENDLLPGEVTVWKPLWSLATGVYHWDGRILMHIPCVTVDGKKVFDLSNKVFVLNARYVSFFNDWNIPPKCGYYDYTRPDKTCSVAVYRETLEEIK